MTTVALLLRDPVASGPKHKNSKESLVGRDFGYAETKVPFRRLISQGGSKNNEVLVIKYISKSTLRWLDTWNEQCFTHLRLSFSWRKVKLFASSKKNRVFEEQIHFLAMNAWETLSQSNLLSFYPRRAQQNSQCLFLLTKQFVYLIAKKVFSPVENLA